VFTSATIPVNGAGNYGPSGSFTPTVPGTYRWRATYSGDVNNAAVTGACGATNEQVTITKASPSIVTQASAGGAIGTQLTDIATVSGGSSPTGTVTFNLYGPNNATCSGNPIFTSTNALVGANATSGAFTSLAAGVYRWTATYNGDANNNSVAHPCNSANEQATITKTTPTIATIASAGGTVGTSISDTATVTGSSPTGTVTFNLYGPNDATCTGSVIFTSTIALAAGSANSGPFTPTAPGVYRWTASYSGDANNNAVSHPCNSANESATISKRSPTIATQASAGGAIGTQLTDVATLSGALAPTGTVTFNLYGPNDATCSGAVIFTSTNNVVGVSATSGAFTTVAAGVYRWTASYSGDANNNAVSHPCNSANESATITKSTPTIATVASAGGNIGTQLTDTATVSGGTNPTGTVTFNLYGPDNATCSGSPIFTSSNVALVGGSATSTAFTTVAAGVYRWTASYSGDANNNAVSHPCNSANESATIGKATPTIVTQASPGGILGVAVLTDTATVSGGNNPTGTVTFNLYGPDNATCSGSPVFTSSNVPLVGGSATSTSYTPTAQGVYRWTASYSGDANNNSLSHPCNSPNESATVIKPKEVPTIGTVASAGGPLGTALTDTATVTSTVQPTGTVTFTLYGPDDATCSGAAIFTSRTSRWSGKRDVGTVHADRRRGLSLEGAVQRGRQQRPGHRGLQRPERIGDDHEGDTDAGHADGSVGDPRRLGHRYGDAFGRHQPDRVDHLQALRPERRELHERSDLHVERGHGERQRQLPVEPGIHPDACGHLPLDRQLHRRRQQRGPHRRVQRCERERVGDVAGTAAAADPGADAVRVGAGAPGADDGRCAMASMRKRRR
jgi:hypothetical protein